MAKNFSKTFYKSKAWKKCRQAYVSLRESIDGGMCEECQSERGYIVHHKVLLTPENINDPETTLNFDNLKFDCKKCHDKEDIHAFIKNEKTLCGFGVNGQPLPPLNQTGISTQGTEGGTSGEYAGNFTVPPPLKISRKETKQ